MNNRILIAFAILSVLVFNSCKNNNSEKNQSKEIKIESEGTIPVGTKSDDYAKKVVDDELANKIKHYITDKFLTEGDIRAITEEQRKFQLYAIDLNNDGNEEVFVKFLTPYFCGTGGCTVLLLNSNLELITRFSPTQTLYVEKRTENSWSVLLTQAEGSWRKLIYENVTYPSNPTMVKPTDEQPSDDAEKLFDENAGKQKTYSF